jgi:hypothetical protein
VLGHYIVDNYHFCWKENAVEDMLNGLVYIATHSHQSGAKAKSFVLRLLGGHASRDPVRLVLEKVFGNSLKTVKDSVKEYASPNVGFGMMRSRPYSVKICMLIWSMEGTCFG